MNAPDSGPKKGPFEKKRDSSLAWVRDMLTVDENS